jgi:hypothetical protein
MVLEISTKQGFGMEIDGGGGSDGWIGMLWHGIGLTDEGFMVQKNIYG